MKSQFRFVLLFAFLLVFIVAPPEFARERTRALAAHYVSKGDLDTASLIYDVLRFQGDPIGKSNYHALNYYRQFNDSRQNRKSASKLAYHAWKETGAAGVGASFWNLAMFSIKYGRNDEEKDRWTTHWLRSASIVGLHEANQLLSAGDEEYSRLRLMATLGDPGAAKTIASVAHRARNTEEKFWALEIAASGGDIFAMTRLGWKLARQHPETAMKWLTMAADRGEISAADTLGDCYNYGRDPCGERAPALAAKYYQAALGPLPPNALPKIYLDSDHAIRLGTTARWTSYPHGVAESAAFELGKLYMTGSGVPLDLERAKVLFELADGWGDSGELLQEILLREATSEKERVAD